jgi:hypothetical protein
MSPLVGLLGQAAMLPSRARPLADDLELGACLPAEAGAWQVRSLSGQLVAAPAGMTRWARLDRFGKALSRVVDAAVDRPRLASGPPTGLHVASWLSCFETNAAFHQGMLQKGPQLASPLLFPYTLPGAAATEVAMLHSLTGAYLVFCGGPAAAVGALVAAADALAEQPRQRLLVATADVLGAATITALLTASGDDGRAALAATTPPLAEAAGALWLGAASESPARPFALEAAFGPPELTATGWRDLIAEALERSGTPASSIHEVLLASSAVVAALRLPLAASASAPALPEQQAAAELVPQAQLLHLAWRVGDCGASLGLLAAAAAIEETEPRLVLARDAGGSVALVVTHD